jgi:hypothetical protein
MRYSRTRLALKYANRSSLLGAAALLSIVGLMLTPWFAPTLVRDLRLTFEGATTRAVVSNKHIALAKLQPVVACLFAHGGGKRRSCYVTYSFNVGGNAYGRTEGVSSSIYNAAQIGKAVEVLYLPDDPNICRVGEPIWQTGIMPLLAVGLLASAASFACAVAGIRDIRRKVRLIAEGTPVLGIIDAVEVGYQKKRAFVRRLVYSYLATDGVQPEVHHAALSSNVPYAPGEVAVGETIVVVLDPHERSRHEIDCFGARDEDKTRLLAEANKLDS